MEFVSDPRAADLQILQVVGDEEFDRLVHPHYVLFIHCYAGVYRRYWAPCMRDAVLVVSAYDLSPVATRDRFSYHRSPYGVDARIFYDREVPRDRTVLTTGYVRYWEAIAECREAAKAAGGDPPYLIHVGKPFWRDGSVEMHEGVTDDELAVLYSRARYVSGLRREEGFELPVVEGLACGARPVCFDTPGYRHWYDGYAVFVRERAHRDLVAELTDVFAQVPEPIAPAEREEVLRRFGWSEICADLWTEILERFPKAGRTGAENRGRQAATRDSSAPCRFRSLDLEETEDGFVIREPERAIVHHLNPTAAVVFELCDGSRDPNAIADVLAEIYDLDSPPLDETLAGLRDLADRGLIYWDISAPAPDHSLQGGRPRTTAHGTEPLPNGTEARTTGVGLPHEGNHAPPRGGP